MTEEKLIRKRDIGKSKARPPKDVKSNLPTTKEGENDKQKPYRYGPLPSFSYQRIWTRGVLILGVLTVVYFTANNGKELPLAKQKEVLHHRSQDVQCSGDYKIELEQFPDCAPRKCGRVVSDKLVSASEAEALLRIARVGLSLGGSDGGVSILDLHSGALSQGKKFINVYKLEKAKSIFQKTDFTIYKVVKTKIHHAVASYFGVNPGSLYLTHPTFFSLLTSAPAQTLHDEYWHPHVDKETYESFHYTSLLYLSDYGRDFEGGRFIFIDSDKTNRTLEPRKGRVSMFTSGSENLHYVEPVISGERYAITVSFTCDKAHAIDDPSVQLFQQ